MIPMAIGRTNQSIDIQQIKIASLRSQ